MSSVPSSPVKSSIGTYGEERDKLASEAAKYLQTPESNSAVYILTCFDFFEPLVGKFDKKMCYDEWARYFKNNPGYMPDSVRETILGLNDPIVGRMYKVGRTDEGMKRYFGKYPSVSKHPPGKDLWLFETYVSFNIPAGGDAQMEVESMFNRWFRGEAPIKGTPGNLNAQMQTKGLTVFPIRDYHRAMCRQKKLGSKNGEKDLNMKCVNYLNSSEAPYLGILLPFDGKMVDGKYVQTSYQKPKGQGGVELVFNYRMNDIRRVVYGATLWWLINQIEWKNTRRWLQKFVYRYPAWGVETRNDTIKLGGFFDWKRVREAVFNFKAEAPKMNHHTVKMWVRLKMAMFNEWQKGNWEELFNLMSNFGIKLYNYPDFTRGALDAAKEDMVAVAEKDGHVPRSQAIDHFQAQLETIRKATEEVKKYLIDGITADVVDSDDVDTLVNYKVLCQQQKNSLATAYSNVMRQLEKQAAGFKKDIALRDEEISELQKALSNCEHPGLPPGKRRSPTSELKNKEILRF